MPRRRRRVRRGRTVGLIPASLCRSASTHRERGQLIWNLIGVAVEHAADFNCCRLSGIVIEDSILAAALHDSEKGFFVTEIDRIIAPSKPLSAADAARRRSGRVSGNARCAKPDPWRSRRFTTQKKSCRSSMSSSSNTYVVGPLGNRTACSRTRRIATSTAASLDTSPHPGPFASRRCHLTLG